MLIIDAYHIKIINGYRKTQFLTDKVWE